MTNYFYLISVEIGNVADNIVVAEFSNQVVSLDFSAGIVITVNGTPVNIVSVKRMDGQKKIQYKIDVSVISTDTVKIFYTALPAVGLDRSSRYGDYVTSDYGTVLLETFVNKAVTNNVQSDDPIGDALRANAMAYWKMDEVSGTRADSTGNGHNLSEVFTTESIPHVLGVTGKINDAAKIQDSTIDAPFLEKTLVNIDVSGGWTVAGWIWVPQFDANAGTWFEIVFVAPSNNIVIHIGIIEVGLNDIGIYNTSIDNQTSISPSAWHFFSAWQLGTTLYIQIDNGAISSATVEGVGTNITRIDVGSLSYTTDTDYILFDELGLYSGVRDSDERSYLYNSGSGRTLYP